MILIANGNPSFIEPVFTDDVGLLTAALVIALVVIAVLLIAVALLAWRIWPRHGNDRGGTRQESKNQLFKNG